ncbi:MAG: hypothetical protein HKN47_01845 [Pirellulaceae bacterium]|nr:hypothetical protein [Pirellulaceae bacterium]
MRRVVKVGGSLLTQPDLVATLTRWFLEQPIAENVVIVGGGGLIDAIRRLDAVRPGDPAEVHWRCVDLLQATSRTFHDWFSSWEFIETADQLQRRQRDGFSQTQPTLVDVISFYRRGGDDHLPEDWRTTTDAIAALLATRIDADELVLLKACDVDKNTSIEHLVATGIVDEAIEDVMNCSIRLRVEKLS